MRRAVLFFLAAILPAASALSQPQPARPAGFTGSDEAALYLAIAGTRKAPPDLYHLIVEYRDQYLSGVRSALRRAPVVDFGHAARTLSSSLFEHVTLPRMVEGCGGLIGELLAAETPPLEGVAGKEAFERASLGPYSYRGVDSSSATGDPAAVSASIARARADFAKGQPPAGAVVSRIVTDETNLLWAIWTGAGGDRRPAKEVDERHGPYTIPGVPR